MRNALRAAALTTALSVFSCFAPIATADRENDAIQLGPRPFYLVDGNRPLST